MFYLIKPPKLLNICIYVNVNVHTKYTTLRSMYYNVPENNIETHILSFDLYKFATN